MTRQTDHHDDEERKRLDYEVLAEDYPCLVVEKRRFTTIALVGSNSVISN